MKKLLLAAILSLTVLLNGCAFTIPWWLLLKNEPSRTRYSADKLITERLPAEKKHQQEKSEQKEIAKSPEPSEPSAH